MTDALVAMCGDTSQGMRPLTVLAGASGVEDETLTVSENAQT
jgi:hypothetical protein